MIRNRLNFALVEPSRFLPARFLPSLKLPSPFIVALLFPSLFLAGCSGNGDTSVSSGYSVRIQFQQQPLADVHVMLYEQAGGPLVLEGWTTVDGTADLKIPDGSSFSPKSSTGAPLEFAAGVHSASDGGWILQPKYADAEQGKLSVTFAVGEHSALLELPKDAVKTL